jgi:hypothetical protein
MRHKPRFQAHHGLLALLCAAAFSPAAAAQLQTGAPFLPTRQHLLAQGWQPLEVHRHANDEFMGTEKALRQQAIAEVESCAMDRALCIFNYRKGRQCLRLFTEGEQVAKMKIYRWTRDCAKQR